MRGKKKNIIPKIVEKVGGKKYLENWAKDVAKKVDRLRLHINAALSYSPEIKRDFEEFLQALREVINPSITSEEAKSFLIQHMITKPIFEALFGEYDFLRQNPVAQAIEQVASHFTQFLKVETEDLEEFYREVQIRAQGVDEREKQEFLKELYDSFFKTAFPDIAGKLGIVYTPVQIIDFIISSVEEILHREFNSSLNKPETKILEPFAGTGTFVARLLQFLNPEDLRRKYTSGEIWANEILLLAYYIGLANLQSVYFEKTKEQRPFNYFLLTDTFQLYEQTRKGIQPKLAIFPKEYTDLMMQETRESINVIISNPPWRAGQKDMTDLNMSDKYPLLDKRIKETYVDKSISKNKNALYDSYVRAIRFASDRIGEKGVIAFVLNNGFIDANSFDGFRKSLVEEFEKIYIFNLRGNARTRGEEWQKEGGKIFG
jgi:predicted helicase